MIRNTSTHKNGMHVSRGATCCARNRHQTWTNAVLAQVRVPFYAFVSLYDAQTITCGQTVPMLSCYIAWSSTCVQQVVIAIQFALSHFPGSYLPIYPRPDPFVILDRVGGGCKRIKDIVCEVHCTIVAPSLRIIRLARIYPGQRFSPHIYIPTSASASNY